MGFVHLHNHTHYSTLDGAVTVDNLISRAIEFGMDAIAITDHGNMCGAIDFYTTAKKKGIKPILGQEFYVAPDNLKNRNYPKGQHTNYHLVLLAENNTGYNNLMKLSSIAYLDGFYYKPRIDFDTLKDHAEGLIASTACLGGEIPHLILNNRMHDAAHVTAQYKELFGPDRFFLELQDHGMPEQKIVNQGLLKLSDEFNLPIIATNDIHYLNRDDAYAHEILLCVQTGKTMSNDQRMKFISDQFYLKSAQEMEKIFADFPDAIFNTSKIAEMCNVELNLGHPVLPEFTVPEGHTLDSYFTEITYKGAAKRFGEPLPSEVKERIEYELSVVQKMGFSGYFLIVWDFIEYAKSQGIPVGPGRGSAAGSIIAYCLGITELNPLNYNLIFERFLNPDRNEMPDIDIDFCGERRDDVIDYVRKKYGDDHVSQIMAFNTMASKAALKDVARALELPFTEANLLTKFVVEKTIQESIEKSPELKEFQNSNEKNKIILQNASKLEGLIRSFGRHACGIVISKDLITDYVPLYKDTKDGGICSQFEKGDCEKAGLVKIDFLGLKNLTIISKTLKLIKQNRGIDLDISSIDLSDADTFKLLQDADTNGIFQLESQGMQNLLRKIHPTVFDDIIAVGALYRPGPLNSGMADQYVKRKRNPKLVQYPHKSLEPVLKDTLGVIVYQEQVMLISRIMGGFSMSEADKLRKAMGKKLNDVIQSMRDKFLKGAKENKIDQKIAEDLYDAMAKFGEYGFNKSHAAAYGLVTYQTAYLKTHFRTEYLTALLSASSGEQKDIILYINDAKAKNIEVLPPSINTSSFDFTIEGEKIRFGFRAIKGIGDKAIENIVSVRESRGEFQSLKDFLEYIDLSVVNKGVLESLIKSGSLDVLHSNRAQMMTGIDILIDTARQLQNDRKTGQGNLFGVDSPSVQDQAIDLPAVNDWPDHTKLAFEKEIVGLYVSGHPLAKYEKEIRQYSSCSISNLHEKSSENENVKAVLVGIIEETEIRRSKKDREFAKGILEDMDGAIPVLMFPKNRKKNFDPEEKESFMNRDLVLVSGSVEFEDGKPTTFFINEIIPLKEARKKSISTLHINIDPIGMDDSLIENLKSVLESNKGEVPVYFHVLDHDKEKIIKAHQCFCINPTDTLIENLSAIVGNDSFRYTFRMSC
ncbi:MAG: DNA polymerase III subunit alpha [Spirochaetes bacterium]|nr:DNA polymerase III subunit alpha [Spirochaetota bacterium]